MAAANALMTVAEAKVILGISGSTDDALLDVLIDAASAAIEQYCNAHLIQATVTERQWGGKQYIYLRKYPIVSVTSITDPAANTVTSTYYYIEKDMGRLRYDGTFPLAYNSAGLVAEWTIVYVAGFFANQGAVTQDVKMACARTVAWLKDNPSPGVTSVGVGSLSVSYGGVSSVGQDGRGIPSDAAALLGKYRNQWTP